MFWDMLIMTPDIFFQIRNTASNLCIDTKYKNANDAFGLDRCNKDTPVGGEQVRAVTGVMR